jgi:hypothetical protein
VVQCGADLFENAEREVILRDTISEILILQGVTAPNMCSNLQDAFAEPKQIVFGCVVVATAELVECFR